MGEADVGDSPGSSLRLSHDELSVDHVRNHGVKGEARRECAATERRPPLVLQRGRGIIGIAKNVLSTGAYWADLQDSQAKYTPPP